MNTIDIHHALQRKEQPISLATVYRTSDFLARLNLLKKVNVRDKSSLFEFDGYKYKNREHVYLIWKHCARVIDTCPPKIPKLLAIERNLTEQHYSTITNIQISFSGSCVSCNK